MTLREFLDKWLTNPNATWTRRDRALEDCYKFFQIMTDDGTTIIDYQDDEFCLVSYDDYLQRYIAKEDAIFLMNKFDFKVTEKAKEELKKERTK